ncbi:MAG: inorganic phosphate transporter [Candidatus Saganbacteria bacterium]|nr:inorganic phosphate transporter [Candidatus Saganbacteria bacterium]
MLSFTFIAVCAIIFLALIFDFINGFHDAANSIATVVSTRVLSPKIAVIWAAFFNFLAAFIFGLAVATTIGKGVIDPSSVTIKVIAAGLVGAVIWDLITWYFGLPTSSSHALIGGFAGAAVIRSGWSVIIVPGLLKIILFIFIAPLLGFILGYLFMLAVYWLFRNASPQRLDSGFRRMQLISAAAYSLGHGGNDAQKTMGIIAVLLFTTGYLGHSFYIPIWVVFACYISIALGTFFGGWRIVKTMGTKITKLRPVGGFCAETAGAITLFVSTHFGIPVSTTHTITGSIMGVGSTKGINSVKWGVAGSILWAWLLTIPASAIIAMGAYLALRLI